MAQIAHTFKEKARTGDVLISENIDFSSLLLSDLVSKGLKNAGFIKPSPIQLKAIPLGRCGLDLIVQAKSGTGKTCVFSVIALDSLQTDSSSIQVLVLAPTREIAVQIWEVVGSIGSAMPGLKCHTFIGGMPLHEDRVKLKLCHIAVGTPGRVKQLIEGGILKTDSIRLFVLDEADKLLEEGFQQQINWIYSSLPENKQMLALSATYPEYLADHLIAYMRNPTFLRLNITDPTLLGIRQYVHTVASHPMSHVVFEAKCKVLTTILTSVSFQQCLVFSNMQTRAQNLAESLTSKGWPTACIAGCLDQKERNYAMAKLKTYKCRILISTDLTSRGIDADKVNLIVNMDIPKDHETYLHRIGRAGRFGSFGIAITLVSEGQEQMTLATIEKRCRTHINPLPDPIPSDLAKAASPIYLDDLVSSEVIHTDGRHSPIKNKVLKKPDTDIATSLSSIHDPSNQNQESTNRSIVESNTGNLNNGSMDRMEIESDSGDNICVDKSNGDHTGKQEYTEGHEHVNVEQREVSLREQNNIVEALNGFSEDKETRTDHDYNSGKVSSSPEPSKLFTVPSANNSCLISEKEFEKCNDLSNPPSSKREWSLDTDSQTEISNTLYSDSERFAKQELTTETETLVIDHKTAATHVPTEEVVDQRTAEDANIGASNTVSEPVNNVHTKERSKVTSRATEKQPHQRLIKPKTTEPKRVPVSLSPNSVDLSSVFKESIGFKHLENPHNYNTAKQSFVKFMEKKESEKDNSHDANICNSNSRYTPVFSKRHVDSEHSDGLLDMVNDLQEMFDRNLLPKSGGHLQDEVAATDVSEESMENIEAELVDQLDNSGKAGRDSDVIEQEESSVLNAENLYGKHNESQTQGDLTVESNSMNGHPEPEVGNDIRAAAVANPVPKSRPKQKRRRPGFQGNFAIAHMMQNIGFGERATETETPADVEHPDNSKSPEPSPQHDITTAIGICSNTESLLTAPTSDLYLVSPDADTLGCFEQAGDKSATDSNIHVLMNHGNHDTIPNLCPSDKLDIFNSQIKPDRYTVNIPETKHHDTVPNLCPSDKLDIFNSQIEPDRYTVNIPETKHHHAPSGADFDNDDSVSESSLESSSLSDSSCYSDRQPVVASNSYRGGTVDPGRHRHTGCRPKSSSRTKEKSMNETRYDNVSGTNFTHKHGHQYSYGYQQEEDIPDKQTSRSSNSRKQKSKKEIENNPEMSRAAYASWYEQSYGNQYQSPFPGHQYPGNPAQQFPWLQNNGMFPGYSPWGMWSGYNPPIQYSGYVPGNMYNPWSTPTQSFPVNLETSMKQAYDIQLNYIQAMNSEYSNSGNRRSRKGKDTSKKRR